MSYFIAPDGYDVITLWAGNPADMVPRAVINEDDLRDDPEVWAAIVRFAAPYALAEFMDWVDSGGAG